MNRILCKKCIEYCVNSDSRLNLIEFSKEKSIKIGEILYSIDNSHLHFAPAGNYPENPVVTICGLATSVQAKEYIVNELKIKDVETDRVCLNAVYQGKMAIKLALMLKALNIDKLIKQMIYLKIDNSLIQISDLTIDELKKSKGMFEQISADLHLTQSTCCWSENNKSTFKKHWWEYSKECRNDGYFSQIVTRFIHSDKSKILILLGSSNNENESIIKNIFKNEIEKLKNVAILSPQTWINYQNFKIDKLICFIHHPANTGYIYNNCKTEKLKSVLYSYYENESWNFSTDRYGRVKNETTNNARDYYKFISNEVLKMIN
ncbi:MAG: hypothetical protein FVQ80_13400 [Planctomycetes bacterium]|nr:hypothetical protein [Planctomycetota bacterium]